MSKKDERQRVFVHRKYIHIDEFFHGKTLDEVALAIQSLASQYEPEILSQDQHVVFVLERDRYEERDELYLEFWRWETDKELEKRLKKKQAAAEKRRQQSRQVEQRKQEEEYAEYQRLRAKFGDQ